MSTVDTVTGEIVESAALATVDKSSALSVIGYLEQARTWLSTCVEMTGPEQIARAKAEIATAAEATKQLHLSKEIQLDAQEMVRRAEYALGKAIRKGQAEGTVVKRGEPQQLANQYGAVHHSVVKSKVTDFAQHSELSGAGHGKPGIYDLADGVEPEQFDSAIEEAKAEGNLSRANVVRKVKKQSVPSTRDQRADLIADLAAQGYSSRQMPTEVGVTEETVRQIAREYDIEIPADKVISKTRRHDSNRIARETVSTLEGLAMGVGLIDYHDLDRDEAAHWATSLDESLKVLNRFRKQIKEM